MLYCNRTSPRGFALIELAGVAVILVVVAALCALLVPDARRRARLAGSLHNLQQIGTGAHAYASDNSNRVFSFSWAPGNHSCDGFGFSPTGTYNDAASHQATCIIRRRAGRLDLPGTIGWVPHVLYNHLVLIDYLGDKLPSPTWISPGDAPRLSWTRADESSTVLQERADAFLRLVCRPAGSGNQMIRWPYSSSYEISLSFVSPDASMNTPQGVALTLQQDTTGHRFFFPGSVQTILGNRFMHEVRFPSHKAMIFESAQRFFGREAYFMAREARVPVLCTDGSAAVRSMNRANPGFQPNSPTSSNPTRVNYTPELTWEPPTLTGAPSEIYDGGIRWTRSGLRGRDFMGPEVPWVP